MTTDSTVAQGGMDKADFQISLVVSTCNRSQDLVRLIAALENQTRNQHGDWELIVVDNRSTDDTAQVVSNYGAQARFPIKYAFESRQGKSYGLNTGISLARGKIIAFTDDDGMPAPEWLERIGQHFEAHPEIACVGGRVELCDPADALVTVRLSKQARVVDTTTFDVSNIPVIGCNMAIDAQVLSRVGLFDTDLGPGSRIGVAEDLDILYRLVRAGHRIGYDSRLLVLHNHGRRTKLDVDHVSKGYLSGRGAFYCKYLLQADRIVARWMYWEMSALFLQWLKAGMFSIRAKNSMRVVGLLLLGAVRYLRHR
jgi:glycosyltransferase involved in cell wall biosynthesis